MCWLKTRQQAIHRPGGQDTTYANIAEIIFKIINMGSLEKNIKANTCQNKRGRSCQPKECRFFLYPVGGFSSADSATKPLISTELREWQTPQGITN